MEEPDIYWKCLEIGGPLLEYSGRAYLFICFVLCTQMLRCDRNVIRTNEYRKTVPAGLHCLSYRNALMMRHRRRLWRRSSGNMPPTPFHRTTSTPASTACETLAICLCAFKNHLHESLFTVTADKSHKIQVDVFAVPCCCRYAKMVPIQDMYTPCTSYCG